MRYRLLMISILLLLLPAGCTKYANIEEVRMGMPLDEFLLLPTPCYLSETTGNTSLYNCQFNVPTGEYASGRAILPYIMTFQDGKLSKITLDQAGRYRQNWYPYYRYPYYHGYAYRSGYWYGYPQPYVYGYPYCY